jgi:hypothetical protein
MGAEKHERRGKRKEDVANRKQMIREKAKKLLNKVKVQK